LGVLETVVILDLIPEGARARVDERRRPGDALHPHSAADPAGRPRLQCRLGQAIAGFGHSKILIVTDSIISKLGLLKGLTDALTEGGARFVVFDEITPDAPIPADRESHRLLQGA
jgi:hypothetical protein